MSRGRKRKLFMISVLLFCIFGIMVSFAEEGDVPKELTLYAQSAVLMDGETGRILWEKNGDIVRPMASTTKIMTCILALEMGLGEKERIVEVSSLAASQPQVHLGMRRGQRFFTRDILYSLMLESHNDSAVAVAEAAAGSVEAFAEKMNQKARELGCKNTWFITPNGLDKAETGEDGKEHIHSTTAEDLALIMRYCVSKSPKAKEFLAITRTSDYSFQDAEKKESYSCHNHNALLTMMEGVLSGKTGFTGGAGYCYVGAVKDNERVFVLALLGCGWPPHKTYKWLDAQKLISYGKQNFQFRNIYQNYSLPPITIKHGVVKEKDGNFLTDCKVSLTVDERKEQKLSLLISEWDKIKVVRNLPEYLEAPVRKGERAGSMDYYLNDQKIASFPIVTETFAERFSFRWCLEWVGRNWIF